MANIVRNKNKKWLLLLLHHDYRVLVKVSSIVIQMKHYYLFEGRCVGEWPTQLETKITQTECRAQPKTCGIELNFLGILN